mmetsp:Transcript_13977/g.26093  ORF Transcript_13977/g.26093 Transcript_13977/m.26093 type:complete len:209 (+) Transcript_13977:54-680(+)
MAHCCNDLGSSPLLQLLVFAACCLQLLVSLVVILGFADIIALPDNAVVEAIFILIVLGLLILWIMLLASRCCAPCCIQEVMPDVPPPCPCEMCSPSNPTCLDYPFFIAVGGQVVTAVLFVVVETLAYQNRRLLRAMRFLRIFQLVWVVLAIVAAFCAIRKFFLMKRGLVVGPHRGATGAVVGSATGYGPAGGDVTVVGAPVAVEVAKA